MNNHHKIAAYINQLPAPKRQEMHHLHEHILERFPVKRLWFDDGKDETGKIVSNPTIGYGEYTIHYANGSSKPFFRIGLSANIAGISVYIMGLKDKTFLKRTYAEKIGKASITGYCIKFKSNNDIKQDVLDEAILHGLEEGS